MKNRIAVVNSHNHFVRWTDRREIHTHQLEHRSVVLLLWNSKSQLLIQKRHSTKMTYPSFWDVSCTGHVEESDYHAGPDDELSLVHERVAHRELDEELGVSTSLEFVGYVAPIPFVHYEHAYLYRGTHDGPFRVQPDEVESVLYVSRFDFNQMKQANEPITPLLNYFVDWLEKENIW